MIQATDLGQFDHPTEFGSERRPGFRRIAR
jgi:hypothetical protein